MVRLVKEMAPTLPNTKWILPHAPEMCITVNRMMIMPAWFDIFTSGDFDTKEQDSQGMLETSVSINILIAAELAAGIPAENIAIGGLSQGCAMALYVGLTTEYKIAGIVCISGYVPDQPNIQQLVTTHCVDIPIFWAHGEGDPQVPLRFAESSISFLKDRLSIRDVTYRT
ncbi:hypothetical protein FRC03_007395 [Tulasnella sp. 419]|nr:hypothetical protein FRC03_007395 [Tulasnella sp. 419]